MNTKRTLALLLFLLPLIVFGQVDGLIEKLNSTQGKEKVTLLNEISKSYRKDKPEKTLEYGLKALELALEIGDKQGEANAFDNIGSGYVYAKNYEKALECYQQSWSTFERLSDKASATSALNNLGVVQHLLKNYEKALDYFQRALREFETLKDKKSAAGCLNNIANIYLNTSKYDEALIFYTKTLEAKKSLNDEEGVRNTLSNIGTVYKALNQKDKALYYLLQALTKTQQAKDISEEMNLYQSIGEVYLQVKQVDSALVYFNNAFEKASQSGNKEESCRALLNSANVYIKNNQTKKALPLLDKCSQYASQLPEKDKLKDVYFSYYQVFNTDKNYQKALEYHVKYSDLNETLLNEKRGKQYAELRIKYDNLFSQQEALQTKFSQSENKSSMMDKYVKDNKMQRMIIMIVALVIVLILLGIIAYQIYNHRQEDQRFTTIENEKMDLHQRLESQKEENNKLVIEKERLQDLNKSHDNFYGIVANNLKNPFTSLIHYSDLMLNDFESHNRDEIKKAFFFVNKESSEGLKMLDNILDWQRSKKGYLSWSPEKVNLNMLINENINKMMKHAKTKKIKLEANTSNSDTYAFGDVKMIKTVLRYLTDNAIRSTDEGGEVKIDTQLYQTDFVQVIFSDTSKGLQAEDASKLFDIEIYQSAQNKELNGVGLGLILCKEYVEKNGGEIWAESDGQGRKITFSLPKINSNLKI